MAIANWRALSIVFSKTGVDFLWGCQLLGSGGWDQLIGSRGDGNRLGVAVAQVVSAASQRYDFVLRLIASAYGMQTASTRQTWAFEVEFLCRFCK
jgi:hypothetical protein